MATNILVAIKSIVSNSNTTLSLKTLYANRANNMGESLELYVKDVFCGIKSSDTDNTRNRAYNANFSYVGNQNNPPDFMIKKGDAIEVKKIEGIKGNTIALNSSYPKEKLYSNSNMITTVCKRCEQWSVKDVVYAIGGVKKQFAQKFMVCLWGLLCCGKENI